MGMSSFIRVGLFKSPVRVVAAFLLRSRETQAKRASEKAEEIRHQKRIHRQQQRVLANAEEELIQMMLEIAQLRAENQRLRQQPPVLPHDPLTARSAAPSSRVRAEDDFGVCQSGANNWIASHGRLPENRVRLVGRDRQTARMDDRPHLADASGSRRH